MPIGSGGDDLTGIEMVGFYTDSRSQNLKILGDWGLSGNCTMVDSQHACCFIITRVTLAAQAQAPNGGEDCVHDLAQGFLNADGFAIIKYCSE